MDVPFPTSRFVEALAAATTRPLEAEEVAVDGAGEVLRTAVVMAPRAEATQEFRKSASLAHTVQNEILVMATYR